MKKKEIKQYIRTYLSSNGGKMSRQKLGEALIANGVVYNEADLYKYLQTLKSEGYVELTEDDIVILLKNEAATPSMSDIYLERQSKVKGVVELSPNAMNQNPPTSIL